MTEPTLGEKLSPVLKEIEETLWEYEANRPNDPPRYTLDGLQGAVKIFMSVMQDYAWVKNKGVPIEEQEVMAQAMGTEIREFVEKYTGIDMRKLYK